MRVRTLGCFLVACAIIGGCSSSDSATTGKGARSDSKPLDEQVNLSLSDEMPARALTSEEQYVVQAAWDRLVTDCMADAGFTWKVVSSRNQPPEPNPYPTLEELRRSGYNVDFEAAMNSGRSNDERVQNDPLDSVPDPDKKAFLDAFQGTETLEFSTDGEQVSTRVGGCASKADVEIYGSSENLAWLSGIVEVATPGDLGAALMDVPGYEPALREWQSCMKGRGISWMDESWPDWDSGYHLLRTKMVMDDVAPSQSVIDDVTAADADCLSSSGLYEVRQANLEDVKEKLWKRADATEAEKWQLQQLALANAKKVP